MAGQRCKIADGKPGAHAGNGGFRYSCKEELLMLTTKDTENQSDDLELWIDRDTRCICFAPQTGFEKLVFSDRETMMRFVLERAERSYKIG